MKHTQLAITVVFCLMVFLLLPRTSTSGYVCADFEDCQALIKFKEGITYDPNGALHDWNESKPFCNWTGITCHQYYQNRVTSLSLNKLDLQGNLSPFLSNLTFLTRLDLANNSFIGEIPTSYASLSRLEHLDMGSNKLEGSVPGFLHACQSLKFFSIEVNNLSGFIPEEIGLMKNLTFLSLARNRLTGIMPPFLANLTELTGLQLADNFFSGKIPEEFGALTKLEFLYLHQNLLEGEIPASLSNCSSLMDLSLIDNRLTGKIPSAIGSKLKNLRYLYLSVNNFSGRIPATLSNLSQLVLLDLSENSLEGEVPADLGKLKNLEVLYLHSNNLVSNSSLTFLVPLANCSRLKKLHLASNLFAGRLPASIGDLSKELYYFNLLNNHITGAIPDSIGNLSSVVTLTLWYNFLDGTIPATLGKLKKLQRLNLGRNKLHGSIPNTLGQMGDLGLLDLSNNSLTGPIPPSLGNLSELRYVYLSHNILSGNIPMEITRCSLLMLIDFSFNNLQGSLPLEIGLLKDLDLSLNISNNNLGGEIPSSIGSLVAVQNIDLSVNKFSGFIPSSFADCVSLESLNLSNNLLGGMIPESLEQIEHLKFLDLSFNQLNGTVPIWLANNSGIKSFNFSYNRLSGEVPKHGRFKDLNISSLMGNAGLCGGSALMGLHPCQFQKEKRKSWKWALLAVTLSCSSLIFFVIVAVFIWYCFLKRKAEKFTEPNLKTSRTRHFTQMELEIATQWFNEANLLGRGSFGSVFKASIENGRSIVAVKVLDGECRQSYKSFKKEWQILSGTKHRNLVQMVGSCWNSQLKALVLQFIDNGSLDQHLYAGGSEEETCGLTLKERLRVAIDIASALEYLHEGCVVQIVHCDLKPENVLLDKHMVAHVADFGIGKLILANDRRGYSTTASYLQGSVGYIPPEYGQSNKVTIRGDVYSYGVMLLELVTLKRPTSEMFNEGLDLRKWVGDAYPDHILDVVDISLKQEAQAEGAAFSLQKLEQCCLQIIDAGLMCTEENPQNRPSVSVVASALQHAWRQMKFQ
ncbi:hypothetical protein Tsubulata_015560 [Turnera subulata]|uniref:non-specific serine/threonine protein kinase n=1 Tax=Turnera subulata TaxID=218843 RepID=A0A9Q0FEI7_9ROSI|nr:hypothetical protein Tsubulata_015560 [Turnera subulata]